MSKKTILIVEDDKLISQFMARVIDDAGYKSVIAENASAARMLYLSSAPEVVLLDLGLPDDDGLNVLRDMKGYHADIPIIVVSARERENEKVKALDLGADDYVTKPFGIFELLARIRTALRHASQTAPALYGGESRNLYQLNGLELDVDQHTVKLDGQEIHFTSKEFKILELLFRHKGKVLTYSWIMQQIWGDFTPADNQILRVNMVNIRRKLKENSEQPRFIKTELGVGYRMIDEENSGIQEKI